MSGKAPKRSTPGGPKGGDIVRKKGKGGDEGEDGAEEGKEKKVRPILMSKRDEDGLYCTSYLPKPIRFSCSSFCLNFNAEHWKPSNPIGDSH